MTRQSKATRHQQRQTGKELIRSAPDPEYIMALSFMVMQQLHHRKPNTTRRVSTASNREGFNNA